MCAPELNHTHLHRAPEPPPQRQKEQRKTRRRACVTQPRFELGTFSVRGRVPLTVHDSFQVKLTNGIVKVWWSTS
ncbi:hypothetical protein HBI52_104110 [Parastagonospora nodorum]|nr:hypothetical protein HBH49_143810 [Parastagonospora nodorum]KAH4170938.1 hypothetical protein HBH43_105390 [Parastagonospora nodorum]KAH5517346.1 hypothetical protein HBI52_104110 [Parastagonospora nodorum]KAH6019706.1 hypothetical protein HBI83_111840 [Parastagonospora nodorum]